jgi:hypothetical protein
MKQTLRTLISNLSSFSLHSGASVSCNARRDDIFAVWYRGSSIVKTERRSADLHIRFVRPPSRVLAAPETTMNHDICLLLYTLPKFESSPLFAVDRLMVPARGACDASNRTTARPRPHRNGL